MGDTIEFSELKPPERILMGPGPSNVHYRVYRALTTPIIGHLDPDFMKIMDDICEMLRFVFQTKNKLTIPISGTGSSGMEASFVNVLEPGDKVVIGVNGVFGERMVHAETSTGAMQPLGEIGKFLKSRETLFLVDTVTSLAGCELKVDELGIDICYSGTQKCLSVPPGLSPITLSEKALSALHSKKSKVQSWYLDLSMIERYWGEERFYHHTAPISMLFALREGL